MPKTPKYLSTFSDTKEPNFYSREYVDKELNENLTSDNVKNINRILKSHNEFNLEREKKKELKEVNSELNELKYLTNSAYGAGKYSDSVALSLNNRINNLESDDDYKSLYSDLDKIRKEAELKQYGTNKTGVLEFINTVGKGTSDVSKALFGGQNSEDYKKEYFSKDNNPVFSSSFLTPTESLTDITSRLKKSRNKYEVKSIFPDLTKLNNELLKTNLNDKNAFNKFITSKFNKDITVPGTNVYLDPKDPEFKSYHEEMLSALQNPNNNAFSSTKIETAKFMKYDSEKDIISTMMSANGIKIQELKSKPELSKKDELELDLAVKTYSKLEQRLKNLDKIYGLDLSLRHGTLQAGISGITDITNLFRTEADGRLRSNAVYQPEILKLDKFGKPVLSTQFTYTKDDGSTGFNLQAVLEGGVKMTAQMLPTLATGSLVGMTARALGAKSLIQGYDALNKVKVFGNKIALADRLSTLATVILTTLPTMVAEEKKWGGNYLKRGFAKALIEGLTESVGVPDIGLLRARPFTLSLKAGSKLASGLTLTGSERLGLYLSGAKQFGKAAIKMNTVEALEEELSLMGNVLLESSKYGMEGFDQKGREKQELTAKTLVDTFTQSFIDGLVYTFGTTGVGGYKSLKKNNVQVLADWQSVNNPELMKAQLMEFKEKGKITEEQFVKGLGRVVELENIFKTEMFTFDNLRNIKTLLDDKDEQLNYFTNLVRKHDTLLLNVDELTEEQRVELAKLKAKHIFDKQDSKRMENVRKEIAVLDEKRKTEELDEKEQKGYETLTEIYLEYKKKQNRVTIDKNKLSDQQKDLLVKKNLWKDNNFYYTAEAHNQEVANINKELLKSKKIADKYSNLSKEEKNDIIKNIFANKTQELTETNDPAQLEESLSGLKIELDYLKNKSKNNDDILIQEREKLYGALGEKYANLTDRAEDGFNEIDRKYEDLSVVSSIDAFENPGEFFETGVFIENNKIHFLDDVLKDNLSLMDFKYEDLIDKLNSVDDVEKVKFLSKLFDSIYENNPTALYSLELVNRYFQDMVEFTQDHVDQAREASIQKRASQNISNISNGNPLNNQTGNQSNNTNTGNTNTGNNNTNTVNTTNNTNTQGNQSLSDEIVSFKDIIDSFFQNPVVKNFITRFEEFPEEDFEILGNAIKDFLNQLPNNKDTHINVITYLNNLFVRGLPQNKVSEFNQILEQIYDGQLNFEDLDDFLILNENKLHKDVLGSFRLIHLIALESSEIVGVEYNKLSTGGNNNPNDLNPENPESPEVKEEETSDPNNQIKPEDKDFQEDNIKDPIIIEQERKIETALGMIKFSYLKLAAPSRTIGIQYDRSDKENLDPKVLRLVKLIDDLTKPNYLPKGSNIVLINRFEFIKKSLKNSEELLQEVKDLILDYKTSSDTTRLDEILGKNYFSESELITWSENNLEGFTTNPDVVVSALSDFNELVLFDGYPLDLNINSVTPETNEYRISDKVAAKLMESGLSIDKIFEHYSEESRNLEAVKTIVKSGKTITVPKASISEGVSITPKGQKETLKSGTVLSANNTIGENPEIVVVTEDNQNLFGKTARYEVGRAYLNHNGEPIKMYNRKLELSEVQVLTDLIFSNTLPESFKDKSFFTDYLFDMLNIINSDNRVYFKPNKNHVVGSQIEKEKPIVNVIRKNKDGNFIQMDKTEVFNFLQNTYWRANNRMIKDNLNIPVFEYEFNTDSTNLSKPKIIMKTVPYIDFVLSTHSLPVNSKGELKVQNANRLIYLELPNAEEIEIETMAAEVSEQKEKENNNTQGIIENPFASVGGIITGGSEYQESPNQEEINPVPIPETVVLDNSVPFILDENQINDGELMKKNCKTKKKDF